MAWPYDDNAWWDNSGLGAGRLLYWLASTIAAAVLLFAIADFVTSWVQGHPILHIVGFAAQRWSG